MRAQFKILSGARAGEVEIFRKGYIGVGRHPLSDVRFDTERDLDVSARHAAVIRRGEAFVVQDLNSRNGTFVNSQRIDRETPLADGDVIGFGTNGPAVEFRSLPSDDAQPAAAPASVSGPPIAVAIPAGEPAPHRSSTAVRVAMEVARQTRSLRRTTMILVAALVVSAVGFATLRWWDAGQRDRELVRLQARADSLSRESRALLARLQSEMAMLHDAFVSAQAEAGRLQRELAAAPDAATVARLRAALEAAERRQTQLVGAAGVDYRGIARDNQNAVALILVEFSASERISGTAFAVDSQGTLVTNGHVLVGERGDRRPRRIAVKFTGSRQWFEGRMVGTSPQSDVGVLRVAIRGGTPRIAGLARTLDGLERGDPVAVIGYPLGLELPMQGSGLDAVAEPTLTAGTVSKVLSTVVQVDGFGAPGSSGSPMFDRSGRVVAVLYGGERDASGNIIYGVPAARVVEYLGTLGLTR